MKRLPLAALIALALTLIVGVALMLGLVAIELHDARP
jgi:hypothetical protein